MRSNVCTDGSSLKISADTQQHSHVTFVFKAVHNSRLSSLIVFSPEEIFFVIEAFITSNTPADALVWLKKDVTPPPLEFSTASPTSFRLKSYGEDPSAFKSELSSLENWTRANQTSDPLESFLLQIIFLLHSSYGKRLF